MTEHKGRDSGAKSLAQKAIVGPSMKSKTSLGTERFPITSLFECNLFENHTYTEIFLLTHLIVLCCTPKPIHSDRHLGTSLLARGNLDTWLARSQKTPCPSAN